MRWSTRGLTSPTVVREGAPTASGGMARRAACRAGRGESHHAGAPASPLDPVTGLVPSPGLFNRSMSGRGWRRS